MASAIWPPPMNAIFFMIVELDTPRTPNAYAEPHHRNTPPNRTTLHIRHTDCALPQRNATVCLA